MDRAALEQLQIKVESGETLTEAEARMLEQAAIADPGPKWRLVIAHALINAERADAALPMMETLVRDAPRHPQTKLGLARAFIALDRYVDAERVLKEALIDRPKDPEALKALAVLALRRDERELARKLVSDALEQDPFDSEAQLISAELDPASRTEAPVAVAIASERAFLDALLAELNVQRVPHLRLGGQLFLKTVGQVGRVDVRGLYDSYVSETRPVEQVVSEIARQLAGERQQPPIGRDELLLRVRPVLREEGFVSKAVGACSREADAGLRLFYVLEDPELVRYVPARLVKQRGLTLEEVHARAMENLAKQPVEVKRVRVDGANILPTGSSSNIVALWEGDGHDGARLLISEMREQLLRALGAQQAVIHLGHRELVIGCAPSDEVSVKQLSELQTADGISGSFLLTATGIQLQRN